MYELFGPLFIETPWDKITRYKEVESHEEGGIGREEMPDPGHEFCRIGWCVSPIATIAVSLTGMVHNHQDGQTDFHIIEIVKSLHTLSLFQSFDVAKILIVVNTTKFLGYSLQAKRPENAIINDILQDIDILQPSDNGSGIRLLLSLYVTAAHYH